MWYRVSFRSPASGEQRIVEVEARTNRSARKEVLRALPAGHGLTVEVVEPVYAGSPRDMSTLMWIDAIAAAVSVAVILIAWF